MALAMKPTVLCIALLATACQRASTLPESAGYGPTPTLPPPSRALIPTTVVAKAIGWPVGVVPTPAAGMQVTAFASGLSHPRFVYVLPNGDALVVEANAPHRPDDAKGLKGFFFKRFQKKAGGAAPSANQITLLRDADGDGVAELRTVFLRGLNAPFGVTVINDALYVANTDAVMRYRYRTGDQGISDSGTRILDLPAGSINHHWTKTIVASPDGTKLYVSIGSNSNAGENGMDQERDRAAIWEIDVESSAHRVFATGLRNAAGLAFEGESGSLWAAVNERDEIGNDLVPDYLTQIVRGAFYGWPYSYFGSHVDQRVSPSRPDLVAIARVPDYALGAHTASIGLVASASNSLPDAFRTGMFVGQHGSWNRKPRSGYRVVFVPFVNGKPKGEPRDVLTGFVNAHDRAMGRPVGLAIDRRGGLLVADDVGNTVWRVAGTAR